MVQLRILSGKTAGAVWVARRFPVRIGRAATADLQLEEDGVWDQHLLLELRPGEGFILKGEGGALASVNDEPLQQASLRNGDIISLGSLKLQFWLREARQGRLAFREALTWSLLVLVSLAQVGLIYWLLR